jgi:hypothetical protein
MAITVEQFIERLTESGLLSAAEISAFQQNLPSDKRPKGALRSLLLLLIGRGRLMEFGGERLRRLLAEGLFDELAGIAAGRAGEALGRDGGFALGSDDNLDCLHATPPICTVNLIEPSASWLSVTMCPFFLASIRHFSTA